MTLVDYGSDSEDGGEEQRIEKAQQVQEGVEADVEAGVEAGVREGVREGVEPVQDEKELKKRKVGEGDREEGEEVTLRGGQEAIEENNGIKNDAATDTATDAMLTKLLATGTPEMETKILHFRGLIDGGHSLNSRLLGEVNIQDPDFFRHQMRHMRIEPGTLRGEYGSGDEGFLDLIDTNAPWQKGRRVEPATGRDAEPATERVIEFELAGPSQTGRVIEFEPAAQ